MANLADRVKETSTTTGTGTLSLAGAVAGYRSLVAGIGTGNQCYYCIEHQTAAEWEVGIGTVTDASPDTLSRTTVLASSNGGSLVNLSAGTKNVFVTYPAGRAVLLDVNNVFTVSQTFNGEIVVKNGAAGAITLKVWDSGDADIDGLHPGSQFGGLILAGSSGHLTLALRENDNNDGFAIISGGGNYATDPTYDTLVLFASAFGNVGIGVNTFGAGASGVLGIGNAAVVPTSSPANMIQVYAKDSSAGSANSTLSIRTEQAVETIGTFTPSHKLRIWINEVEYWIQLDAV